MHLPRVPLYKIRKSRSPGAAFLNGARILTPGSTLWSSSPLFPDCRPEHAEVP
jgi:hypothetical protein